MTRAVHIAQARWSPLAGATTCRGGTWMNRSDIALAGRGTDAGLLARGASRRTTIQIAGMTRLPPIRRRDTNMDAAFARVPDQALAAHFAARASSSSRSRPFCVIAAARSKSACPSLQRPSLDSRSPRTLHSRW
jgi:hypothetical protein